LYFSQRWLRLILSAIIASYCFATGTHSAVTAGNSPHHIQSLNVGP
jgi:hypothetical protein